MSGDELFEFYRVIAVFTFTLGIFYYGLTISWNIQCNLGNWLKHYWPKCWLRKIWPAMCDIEGGCEYCSNICNACGQWIQWQYNWKKRELIKKNIEIK